MKPTYNVTAIYDDCVISVETNSADTAICALLEHAENGCVVDVVNNYTGEVLATANHDEPYVTEEWSLMILGWLMKTAWEFGSEI